jgi:anti-sigma factor RsiW
LLGAYALDALDADDRARVDAYLERDAAARAEVDELRETAASLALAARPSLDAPPELWERIAGAIAAERRRPPDAGRRRRARAAPAADARPWIDAAAPRPRS